VSAVVLALDGTAAPEVAVPTPVRQPLSVAAADELARRCGVPLPWHAVPPSAVARGLSGSTAQATRPVTDPAAELRFRGLLSAEGRLDAGLVGTLGCFAAPEVFVDLVLGRPGGSFRAWHRLLGTRVVALARCGDRAELGWWDDRRWAGELARLVAPPASSNAAGDSAARRRVPAELLLGCGAALRLGRPELLAELVTRHDAAAVAAQVRLLHAAARGRLLVTVAGVRRDGRRTLGLLSWVLLPDGWRELVPAVGGAEPVVAVDRVDPTDLGSRVARLVARARA
jgi:hypothetical protein